MQPLTPSSHFCGISKPVIQTQKLWLFRTLGETKQMFWFVWRSVLSPVQCIVAGRDLEESSSPLYQTAGQGSSLPVDLIRFERWTTAENRNHLHSIKKCASFSSPWLLLPPLVPLSLLLHFLVKNTFVLTPSLIVSSCVSPSPALSLHEHGSDSSHTSAAIPVVSMTPYK